MRAGYSQKTFAQLSYQLLQKTSVQNSIQELRQHRNERNKIDADYVLKRLVEIDQMDIEDSLNSSVVFLPIKNGRELGELYYQDWISPLSEAVTLMRL
ncbi:terminase small subunit [Frischella perrara]|uniref:terminase small subunit n=1 Tax=Frischella perrara TaxID=1267021 RepID=UPI003C6CFAE7